MQVGQLTSLNLNLVLCTRHTAFWAWLVVAEKAQIIPSSVSILLNLKSCILSVYWLKTAAENSVEILSF